MEDPAHAAHHVVKDMAMEEPASSGVGGGKFDGVSFHGHHVDGVFQGGVIALSVQHPEVMPMQVYGVAHHGIVVKDDPYIFSFFDEDFIAFGNGFIVECPYV